MPRVAILTRAVDSAPTPRAGCQPQECTQEPRHKLGTELKIKHDLSWSNSLVPPSEVRFQRKVIKPVWLYMGHPRQAVWGHNQPLIPLGKSQQHQGSCPRRFKGCRKPLRHHPDNVFQTCTLSHIHVILHYIITTGILLSPFFCSSTDDS